MTRTLITTLLFLFSCFALSQPAQRVITLSPQGTELAYAAGLGDAIVAVSEHSDYPKSALNIERVANHRGLNLERIVALNPDLILAWEGGNPSQQLLKLRQLGYTVINTYPDSLDDIARVITQLSQWSSNPAIGMQAADEFSAQLNHLKEQYKDMPPVRFFYQLSTHPLISVNRTAWPGSVFEICNGENIFGDSAAPYPQISPEQVISRQPDVIFLPHSQESDGEMWQRWKEVLPAVQNANVISLNSDWLNRATPRSLMAAADICAVLHP
ncbi:vitamin B12 ABC transporter substrate-binding protein BtuF [Thaumasiovibrio sp. DFM-14]|uniref:vitamin B12 ABC transporter substrate-binding protein BtuF n=1 Tax=Thaumasiovibrio sp. DFM-14 TaxID=3384792 RepID=UPI0039A1E877